MTRAIQITVEQRTPDGVKIDRFVVGCAPTANLGQNPTEKSPAIYVRAEIIETEYDLIEVDPLDGVCICDKSCTAHLRNS